MHTVRAMKSRGAVVARSMLDLWLAEGIIRLFLQAFWRTARVTTGLGCILLIASHKHLHASCCILLGEARMLSLQFLCASNGQEGLFAGKRHHPHVESS